MEHPLAGKFAHELASSYQNVAIFTGLFGLAILGRVLFQPLPSVDPLLPIAFIAGQKYGKRYGLLFGASAYFASNFFVIGGQGIWTIPMVIGAAGVGLCGGLFRHRKYIGILLGIVFYELVVNLMLVFMFNPLFALPFAAVHIVSSLGFIAVGDQLWKMKEKYLARA